MTVIGLHPEELLDRAARGALVGTDRARLDAHLAACTACRLELALRDDFQDELEAPAARVSGSVAAALGRLAADAPVPPGELLVPPPAAVVVTAKPGSRSRRLSVLLLAAAVLLVGGVAGAGGLAGLVRRFELVISPPPAAPLVIPVAPSSTRAIPAAVLPSLPSRVATEPDAAPPPAGIASLTIDAPAAAVPTSRAVAIDLRTPGPVPTILVQPSVLAAPPEARPATSTPTAATTTAATPDAGAPGRLFAEANDARRRGELERAVALYRELERRHPDTEEAKVARATVGRLLLERGDTASALDRFDAYLDRSRGALTQDAMIGRAEALRRLGRSREEAAAWAALLAKYPDSAQAAKARARLAELGSR